MKLKIKQLNNSGLAHHAVIAILAVALVAGVGAYRVFFSGAWPSYNICYRVTTPAYTGSRIEGTNMFHKSGTQTYAFENSPAGVRYAASHAYTSIDIDVRVTKDGVPVVTHWPKPMRPANGEGFYDPQHTLSTDSIVENMTFAQVSRLRNTDGKSQIYSLNYMIQVAANNKINLSIEMKTSTVGGYLNGIAEELNRENVKAYMKGPATTASINTALTEARDHGFWTRGTEETQGWKAPGPNCR